MAEGAPQESLLDTLIDLAGRFNRFVEEHRPEIEAAGVWGTVNQACVDARLYAPFDGAAWNEIYTEIRRQRDAGEPADPGPVILGAYGSGGVGFAALAQELRTAKALSDRRHEVEEILASLTDGRNYVATCATLPLVESVLTRSAGRWKKTDDLLKLLRGRLHDEDPVYDEGLLVGYAAVEMVFNEIPEIWKPEPHRVGQLIEHLNRNLALHGTAAGWDGATNATRAALLLAATARVVGLFVET